MNTNKSKNRPEHEKYLSKWKPKTEKYVKGKHRRQQNEREINGENRRGISTKC